ncbi:ComEC/Rec2 family competence protein [Siphonobacter aquaeclarae]|uniref:Metallo-beta-lactamase superfamily protein n=1 Tax=Siphonobacter aquaeclarae TaxID=563176 RepID=A0A1G9RF24_9BACT|nr:hypothetical protein [Siphonobacter aquaeclarae]SDM21824.1 hypothetical protein SAMN04488090_2872 [Siphonobacter aquaeclarae]
MPPSPITHCEVRMYRMGTGDCFALRFFAGEVLTFRMMIDCGTWQGSSEKLRKYVSDLKTYLDNHVDLLVVTHEHKDHVYGFEACQTLFGQDFTVSQTWMAWTEDETAPRASQWLKDFGDKKKALMLAGNQWNRMTAGRRGTDTRFSPFQLAARRHFAQALSGFTELQFAANENGEYVGMLKGMSIVRNQIANNKIRFCHPGEIIASFPAAPGIRFYVLGPPTSWEAVKTESGEDGESYSHNLAESDAFAAAVLAGDSPPANAAPFEERFLSDPNDTSHPFRKRYEQKNAEWRQIGDDWLNSAGSLALRVNSMTNNLSLALAIEFEESGRVMLFPGDAEYGSWRSWHGIDWAQPARSGDKHLTEDLLNRTVFYKVAHHLSHNGTARRLGLEMMNHPDLVAMATLDYNVISNGWKTTMPNREIVNELLRRTKGRLIVMNEDQLEVGDVPLSSRVAAAKERMTAAEQAAFDAAFAASELYFQFTVKG